MSGNVFGTQKPASARQEAQPSSQAADHQASATQHPSSSNAASGTERTPAAAAPAEAAEQAAAGLGGLSLGPWSLSASDAAALAAAEAAASPQPAPAADIPALVMALKAAIKSGEFGAQLSAVKGLSKAASGLPNDAAANARRLAVVEAGALPAAAALIAGGSDDAKNAAALLVAAVMASQSSKVHVAAADAGVIDALVNLLVDSEANGASLESAVMALNNTIACAIDAPLTAAVQCGAIPALVALLSSPVSTDGAREWSLIALRTLALLDASLAGTVAAVGVLEPACALLCGTASRRVGDAAALLIAQLVGACDTSAALQPLVAALQTGDPSRKESSVSALARLSISRHFRRADLLAAGGLPALVSALQSEDVSYDAKKSATIVLAQLAHSDDATRRAVMAAGALPSVIALLSTVKSSEQAKSGAAGVIGALADSGNAAIIGSIISAGAALPLAELLSDATSDRLKQVFGFALYKLAQSAAAVLFPVLSANGAPGLKALCRALAHGAGSTQDLAEEIIVYILMARPDSVAAFADAGVIVPLVAVLDGGSARARGMAAAAALALTTGSGDAAVAARIRRGLEAAGAVPALVRNLFHPSRAHFERVHSAGALHNIIVESKTTTEAAAAEVVAARAMHPLATMLADPEEEARFNAAGLIAVISASPNDALHAAIASYALPALATALSDRSPGVQLSACTALKHVAFSSPLRRNAVSALDVEPRLLQLSRAGGQLAVAASEALAALRRN